MRDTEDFSDVKVVARCRIDLRVVRIQLVGGEGVLVVDTVARVTRDDGVGFLTVHTVPAEAEFLRDLEVGAVAVDGAVVYEGELVRRDVVLAGYMRDEYKYGVGRAEKSGLQMSSHVFPATTVALRVHCALTANKAISILDRVQHTRTHLKRRMQERRRR